MALSARTSRLDANGLFDPTFVADTDGSVQTLVAHQGQVLAGGFFARVNNQPRRGVARLNPLNGLLDLSFTPSSTMPCSTWRSMRRTTCMPRVCSSMSIQPCVPVWRAWSRMAA
ncbi:MAG: delta-60 repeat domain-containing protein [Ahniella sp.]|nr:delta-60 repeat domain-containing protein [Ahniella sp.]